MYLKILLRIMYTLYIYVRISKKYISLLYVCSLLMIQLFIFWLYKIAMYVYVHSSRHVWIKEVTREIS